VSATRAFSPLLRKEVRALLPIWLAAATTVAAVMVMPRSEVILAGLLAFVLGTTTLGAMSIGHEYAYRTLPQLLALPADRRRLFAAKLAVLTPMLAGLSTLAALAFLRAAGSTPADGIWVWTLVLLSLLGGLAIAPWLTMACRSPIAGVVFTLAVPAALWVGSEAINGASPRGFGRPLPADRELNLAVLWGGMLMLSVMGAVLSWRAFLGLEAPGGDGEMHMPSLDRIASSQGTFTGTRRARKPFAAIVAKELRLQSITFIVAGLYVLTWAALMRAATESYALQMVFGGVTIVYGGLAALLVGAVASAEERGFGTLEWQILQPYAARKQWTLKVMTALALSLVLAFVLPALLAWIRPVAGSASPITFATEAGSNVFGMGILYWRVSRVAMQLGLFAVLTACALYVSSVCASGLRALLLTLPFVTAGAMLTRATAWAAYTTMFRALDVAVIFSGFGRYAVTGRDRPPFTDDDARFLNLAGSTLTIGLVCGFVCLVLWFAARNHTSAERGVRRTRRQLAWLTAYAVAGAATAGGLPVVIWWRLATT
jgi:ABC-type transport system involved in multi-copper enzyme maturation permease subunit